MNDKTLVQVFAGIRVRGAATQEQWDQRQHGRVMPLDEAWYQAHDDDAMIARYRVEGVPSAPRLKKRSALYQEIRDQVEVPILIGDIDEPGLPKDQVMTEAFRVATQEAIEACAEEIELHAYCTTRGGFHLLWVLAEPVTPEESEALYKDLSKSLRGHELTLDPACKDWTRLVRAPDAVRDGQRLSDLPHFTNKVFGAVYSPGEIDASEAPQEILLERDAPEPGEVNAQWKTRATTLLHNQPSCSDRRKGLLAGERNFGEGIGVPGRHEDMLNLVGWVVSVLIRAEFEFSSEDIYKWFYWPAARAERPGDQRPQTEELWRIVEWVVSTQAERHVAEQRTSEEEVEDLGGEDVLRRTALVNSTGYFLINKDGTYGAKPAAKDALYNELRETGMDTHAPIDYVDQAGRLKDVSKSVWLNRYSLTLHRQLYGTHEGGALFSEVDGVRQLKVPLYTRTKLKPLEPTPEIMGWFRVIEREVTNGAGFLLHLAHMPTYWRGPCAALGLLWPTGAGKSMLLDAIRQLIHEGALGGAACYGGFQDHLLKTPYLLIDEGFSRVNDRHSISDSFKEYATGGTITINPKGKPEVCISEVYPRQAFACESQELFSVLLSSSNKSIESLDATNTRIRMYKTNSTKISDYLNQIGGEAVTRSWTDPRNPLLTRAILWLCETARESGELHARGHRFGVPEVEDRVLNSILLTSSESSIMDHALALMISQDREDYWLPDKEAFFFRVEEVLHFIKQGSFLRTYSQCRTWTSREVKRELRRMGPNVKRSRPHDRGRANGYQVDPINITHVIVGRLNGNPAREGDDV